MSKESEILGIDVASESEVSKNLPSGNDFRTDSEDNISSTGWKYLNFVDAATHQACQGDSKMHPASPKRNK
jgi:hypothetical protein